jgi:adenine-specific DNA-methyltransferase
MIENRLLLGLKLLEPGGILEVAIDDYEGHRLRMLIDMVLGEDNRLGSVSVVHNPGGRHDDKFIATAHEYMLVYSNQKSEAVTYNLPLSEEDVASFKYRDAKGAYRLREFRRSGSHSTRFDRPNMWYPIYYDPKTKEIDLDKKEGMVEIWPIDPKGIERVWRWGKDTLQSKKNELIIEQSNGTYIVKVKARLEEKGGLKPKSIWNKPSYSSALGTTLLKDILGKEGMFSYPKSLELVIDALRIGAAKDSIILDFFAGSGTTAHAVLKLNAEDKGNRKYILVEMEDYFEKVLLSRIKKIMYSESWRNGLPVSQKGYSHVLKYMYLEQYEDSLNNIVFLEKDRTTQETLDEFGDYILKNMLEFETRGSPTRLNVEQFQTPFDYKIWVTTAGEKRLATVDLVETFNYLLGITVEKFRTFKNQEQEYRCIFGKLNQENIAIIWRNTKNIDLKKDKEFIEKTILAETKPDRIFINGDSLVEKAEPIEPEFKRLMGA